MHKLDLKHFISGKVCLLLQGILNCSDFIYFMIFSAGPASFDNSVVWTKEFVPELMNWGNRHFLLYFVCFKLVMNKREKSSVRQ